MTALTSAFTEKYGVKVEVWRGSSKDDLARRRGDPRGSLYRRYPRNQWPGVEALTRRTYCSRSPHRRSTRYYPPPSSSIEAGSTRLNVITSAYNTNLVQAADVPKTWTDFLNPAFKGKLGIEAEDFDWLAAVVKNFPSEAEGIDFFKKLAATNGLSVRKGHIC